MFSATACPMDGETKTLRGKKSLLWDRESGSLSLPSHVTFAGSLMQRWMIGRGTDNHSAIWLSWLFCAFPPSHACLFGHWSPLEVSLETNWKLVVNLTSVGTRL